MVSMNSVYVYMICIFLYYDLYFALNFLKIILLHQKQLNILIY